jgi:hypothetical protein
MDASWATAELVSGEPVILHQIRPIREPLLILSCRRHRRFAVVAAAGKDEVFSGRS